MADEFRVKNGLKSDGPIDQTQQSTPANPASGSNKLYFKSDDSLYILDSSGTETELGAAGAAAPDHTYQLTNLGLQTSVATNNLTIDLVQSDGSTDPASGTGAVKIAFHNATITTGSFTVVSVTSALSITVDSGETLGHTDGDTESIFVYALNNGGTVELAVASKYFDEGILHSTTALSASADDADVLYSTTARSNVPIRLIGRLLSTQTTAGTWAANMDSVRVHTLELKERPFFITSKSMTRITGGDPNNLGEYRSQLRNASAATYTDTNGAPTDTPSTADGIRIYEGNAWSSADDNNQPSRYDIFIGKNVDYSVRWYRSSGRTGDIDTTPAVVTGGNDFGYVVTYDETTGVITFAANLASGGSHADHIPGFLKTGASAGNVDPYFDILIKPMY